MFAVEFVEIFKQQAFSLLFYTTNWIINLDQM